MKYLVMIYHDNDAWNALPEEEQLRVMHEGGRMWQDLVASGEGIMGEPLGDPADSKIIRPRHGLPQVTDGPFSEAKEQFVGVLIIDVASEERAVEIATSWPEAKYSPLEVRLLRSDNAEETARLRARTA